MLWFPTHRRILLMGSQDLFKRIFMAPLIISGGVVVHRLHFPFFPSLALSLSVCLSTVSVTMTDRYDDDRRRDAGDDRDSRRRERDDR